MASNSTKHKGAGTLTRHQRLTRSMRNPVRAARRAKKLRRQANRPLGRPGADTALLLPGAWLAGIWNNRKADGAQ